MLEIKSPAFSDKGAIPKKFTQEGANISPPLEWTTTDPSVKQYALICEDPDAPMEKPYIHWVIYGIDASVTSLPEAIDTEPEIDTPVAAVQGKNTADEFGYAGPMPPVGHGWHRYYFRLFALDRRLDLEPGLTSEELLDEIRSNVIVEAELVGRYQRSKTEQLEHGARP